ncbi:hypothetical protein BJ969_003048 [Saccharopolyspora gloriosae]|uniref:Uncharacterized protein n=1 Tax=Saccharopolyspora gloriosae TaxID=455344 RepID=A0A840NDF7_9PSEU|nr:hypothetical protein [Saccharopolyspora gloriosae]
MGPRVFRIRASTRGAGIGSGIGPFPIHANSGYGRHTEIGGAAKHPQTRRSALPAR